MWFDPTEQHHQHHQQQPLILDSTLDVDGDGGMITQPGNSPSLSLVWSVNMGMIRSTLIVNPLTLPTNLLDMTTSINVGARGILVQPSSRRPATAPPTAPGQVTVPSSSSYASNKNNNNHNDNPHHIDSNHSNNNNSNNNNNNNNNNNRRTSDTGVVSTALRATVQFDNSVVDRADRPRPSKTLILPLMYPTLSCCFV